MKCGPNGSGFFGADYAGAIPVISKKNAALRQPRAELPTALASYQRQASGDGRQPSINLLFCSKIECQTKPETNAGQAAYTKHLTGSPPPIFYLDAPSAARVA